MQIVEGVNLHVIKTGKFKTNHLTCRFSGDVTRVNKASRTLVAQMLATANASYPTSRLFRQKLAELYGAHLSTKIVIKGLIHIVDIDISFVDSRFVPGGENLLVEVFNVLAQVLYNPLRIVEQYQTAVFNLEKANLINYLEADKEDVFYYSDLELDKLYFSEPSLQEPKYSTAEQVDLENSYTAFQEFRRMLREDQIDLFVVGDLEESQVQNAMTHLVFEPREINLSPLYQQEVSNLITKKFDSKQGNQSVLDLAYHVPITYGGEDYVPLLAVNGLFGVFPHSLLFTEVREKAGLAYTISSHLDPYRGFIRVQAGIDSKQRLLTFQLITRQLIAIRSGRFGSHLLEKTKKMLISSAALSKDNPKILIEQAYNKIFFGSLTLQAGDFEQEVEAITKADIMRVASQISLQALYFLEGEDS